VAKSVILGDMVQCHPRTDSVNYVQTFIFAFVIAFRNIKFGSHNFSAYYANVPSRSIQYPFTFHKFQLHILLFQNISIFPKRSTPCIILLCCLARMDFSCKISSYPVWDNPLIFTNLSKTYILTSKMSCFIQQLKACLCSQTKQSLTFPNDWIRRTFHIHSCENVM